MDEAVNVIIIDILGSNYVSNVNSHIFNNIRKYVEKTVLYQETLNEEIEKFKTESEQNTFALENSLLTYEKNIDDLQTKLADRDEQYNYLDEKYKESQNGISNLNEKIEENNLTIENLKSQNKLLTLENNNIKSLNLEKQNAITGLQNDLKMISQKLLQITTLKNDCIVKIDQKNERIIELELELKQNIKYKESLVNQAKDFDEELLKKENNMTLLIKEKTQQISLLNNKNEELECSFNSLLKKLDKMNDKIYHYESQNSELIEKIYQMETEYTQKESDLQNQLKISEQKGKTLEQSCKESMGKYEQLKLSLEEMKKVLVETQKSYKIIDIELKQLKKIHTQSIADKDAKIKELGKEVEELNKRSDSHDQNDAEKSVRIIELPAGDEDELITDLSYAQLYGKYVEVSNELRSVKGENQKLVHSMDCIMEEIERKAPVLIKQGYEYKNALKTIAVLTNELQRANGQLDNFKSSKQDLTLELKIVKQHCARLKSYILTLRDEIKEFSGFGGVEGEGDHSFGDDCITTTTPDRGPPHIYLAPHKRLRETVEAERTAKGRSEAWLTPNALIDSILENVDEGEIEDAKDIMELSEKIAGLEKEMVQFRDVNEDQKKVIEALKRQKDTYHQMLIESGLFSSNRRNQMSNFNDSLALDSTSERDGTSINLGDTSYFRDDIVIKMTTELERIKKDYVDQEKGLKARLQECELQINEYKLNESKINYELHLLKENMYGLKSKYESCQAELLEAQSKVSQSAVKYSEKQGKIDQLTTELTMANQKVSGLEYRITRIRAEKEMLESERDQMDKLKSANAREETKYAAILENLKTLQSSFEMNEKESLAKLIQQNELLDRERKELKIKNETDALESKNKIHELEKRLEHSERKCLELGKQIQTFHGEEWKLREENNNLHKSLSEQTKLQQQHRITGHKRTRSQAIDSEIFPGSANISALETSMNEELGGESYAGAVTLFQSSPLHTQSLSGITKIKDDEIRELKNAIKKNEEHISHYQIITSTLESQFKQHQDLVENLERILEEQFKAALQSKEYYETKTKKLNDEIERLNAARLEANAEKSSEIAVLRAKIESLSERLSVEAKGNTELTSQLNISRDEGQTQQTRLDKALLDVSVLSDKIQHLTRTLEFKGSESDLQGTVDNGDGGTLENASLEAKLDEILKQKLRYQTENEELLQKYRMSQEFCDVLCNEMAVVKTKLDALSEIQDSNAVSLADISLLFGVNDQTDSTETDAMLKFINYLRQDNQTVRDNVESLKAEVARYKVKAEMQESELTKLGEALNEEISKNQTYDYLGRIHDLEMSLEDVRMAKEILQQDNSQLEARYAEILAENAKSDAQRRDKVAHVINDLTKEKDALLKENRELRISITRSEFKYDEQGKRMQAINLQIETLGAQNKTLSTILESKDDSLKALQEQVGDIKRELLENKLEGDSKETDFRLRITDCDEEIQGLKAKIEEMKVTNIKLKTIARKYKQLHENSISQQPSTSGAIVLGDGSETLIPSLTPQQETNFMSGELAMSDNEENTKNAQLVVEINAYKTKCQEMQKDLEEKNLRLASLKSQYEARFNRLRQQLEKSREQTPESTSASPLPIPAIALPASSYGEIMNQPKKLDVSPPQITADVKPSVIPSSSVLPIAHSSAPCTSVLAQPSNTLSQPQPLPKANIKPFSPYSHPETASIFNRSVVSPIMPVASTSFVGSFVTPTSLTSASSPPLYSVGPQASGPTTSLFAQGSGLSQSTTPHQKPAVCIKPLSFGQYHPGNNYGTSMSTKAFSAAIGIASPNVFLSGGPSLPSFQASSIPEQTTISPTPTDLNSTPSSNAHNILLTTSTLSNSTQSLGSEVQSSSYHHDDSTDQAEPSSTLSSSSSSYVVVNPYNVYPLPPSGGQTTGSSNLKSAQPVAQIFSLSTSTSPPVPATTIPYSGFRHSPSLELSYFESSAFGIVTCHSMPGKTVIGGPRYASPSFKVDALDSQPSGSLSYAAPSSAFSQAPAAPAHAPPFPFYSQAIVMDDSSEPFSKAVVTTSSTDVLFDSLQPLPIFTTSTFSLPTYASTFKSPFKQTPQINFNQAPGASAPTRIFASVEGIKMVPTPIVSSKSLLLEPSLETIENFSYDPSSDITAESASTTRTALQHVSRTIGATMATSSTELLAAISDENVDHSEGESNSQATSQQPSSESERKHIISALEDTTNAAPQISNIPSTAPSQSYGQPIQQPQPPLRTAKRPIVFDLPPSPPPTQPPFAPTLPPLMPQPSGGGVYPFSWHRAPSSQPAKSGVVLTPKSSMENVFTVLPILAPPPINTVAAASPFYESAGPSSFSNVELGLNSTSLSSTDLMSTSHTDQDFGLNNATEDSNVSNSVSNSVNVGGVGGSRIISTVVRLNAATRRYAGGVSGLGGVRRTTVESSSTHARASGARGTPSGVRSAFRRNLAGRSGGRRSAKFLASRRHGK